MPWARVPPAGPTGPVCRNSQCNASRFDLPRSAAQRGAKPHAHPVDGARQSATARNNAPCGQLVGSWMWMRAKCSITRAPILIRRRGWWRTPLLCRSHEEKARTHGSFTYRARSWTRPRKVVAQLECSCSRMLGEATSDGMRQAVDVRYVVTSMQTRSSAGIIAPSRPASAPSSRQARPYGACCEQQASRQRPVSLERREGGWR